MTPSNAEANGYSVKMEKVILPKALAVLEVAGVLADEDSAKEEAESELRRRLMVRNHRIAAETGCSQRGGRGPPWRQKGGRDTKRDGDEER